MSWHKSSTKTWLDILNFLATNNNNIPTFPHHNLIVKSQYIYIVLEIQNKEFRSLLAKSINMSDREKINALKFAFLMKE